jgi:hypothetical protein
MSAMHIVSDEPLCFRFTQVGLLLHLSTPREAHSINSFRNSKVLVLNVLAKEAPEQDPQTSASSAGVISSGFAMAVAYVCSFAAT